MRKVYNSKANYKTSDKMSLDARIKSISKFIPAFKSKISEIPINNIESNPYNPRKRFGQEEEDELIESINSKSILQPVIVYKKKGDENYILLDGQRRLQACRKLGIKEIPAHILVKEPSFLENISIMFHIHNVHEDWTDLAIATTINRILDELKINKKNPTKEDVKNIKKLTSLSAYKIKKYLDVLKFSDSVRKRFMDSELKESPDLDIDLLSELRMPIKRIKTSFPSVAKRYPEDKIVDVFIQKKKDGVIKANKEIRKLSKVIINTNKGKINPQVAKEKLIEFFDNRDVSIDQVYSDTAEAVEQTKTISNLSEKLEREIENIDLRKVPKEDKKRLYERLTKLMDSIKRKMEVR